METSKRYAHSQILWMTRNPLLCQTHFILFVSIIELLLFISTNGAVCWPAPRIFGKAPSILQITYISSQRGWGVRPMVASVVLKIRCGPKSEKWSDLDFIGFYLCHVVRCHFTPNYFQKRPTRHWKTEDRWLDWICKQTHLSTTHNLLTSEMPFIRSPEAFIDI